jgi:ferritin-like metal-binding protein YciE
MAGKTQAAPARNSGNGARKSSAASGPTASTRSTSQRKSSATEASLDQLLEKLLQDTYSAEKQLLDALPELARAADNEDLQDAFESHLAQTRKHVERIEKVCSRLGIEPEGESCAAMEGLIEESRKVISEYDPSPVRDSALIIAAQKVEHYEIASYGSLCELADVLGHHRVSDILGRTFSEEERTDYMLSDIARFVNDEACEMNGNYDREEEEL